MRNFLQPRTVYKQLFLASNSHKTDISAFSRSTFYFVQKELITVVSQRFYAYLVAFYELFFALKNFVPGLYTDVLNLSSYFVKNSFLFEKRSFTPVYASF